VSGRELQTLSGTQGSVMSSFGVYFIAFTADGRIVTIGDAIRVWDVVSGKELSTADIGSLSISGLTGGGGGAALSSDGNQLATLIDEAQIKVWDLTAGREARSLNLEDKRIDSGELCFTPDGHLLLSGIVDKRWRLWDVTAKVTERELGPTGQDHSLVRFSYDGRLLSLAEGYTVRL